MGCGIYVAIEVLCGFIGRLSSVLAELGVNLGIVQAFGLNGFSGDGDGRGRSFQEGGCQTRPYEDDGPRMARFEWCCWRLPGYNGFLSTHERPSSLGGRERDREVESTLWTTAF